MSDAATLKKTFEEMQKRFKPNTIDKDQTVYFSLGDGPGMKWTMWIGPSKCEIKEGKLGRMLRDATYTGQTPVFWGSLDAVAGPEEWTLHGLTNCGKGQPGQHAHVSHGASPARFRNVQVGFRQ